MPTVWAALRNCCAKLPFLLSEVVFINRVRCMARFLPADKAIFRSNPDRIARESNAGCEQKGRSGGVQCL